MTNASGSVQYLRRKNLGNYEHEEASVKLDFMAGEGQLVGPALDAAAAEAKLKTLEMLGQVAPERKVAPPTNEAHDPSKPVARHRRTKEQIAADEAAKAPVTDPTAMEDSKPEKSAAGAATVTVPASDPTAMADEDFDAPTGQARVIPDKELSDACSTANTKTHNSAAIRKLISDFALPPGGSKSIPQERRAEFLDGLAKIPVIAE